MQNILQTKWVYAIDAVVLLIDFVAWQFFGMPGWAASTFASGIVVLLRNHLKADSQHSKLAAEVYGYLGEIVASNTFNAASIAKALEAHKTVAALIGKATAPQIEPGHGASGHKGHA